MSRPTVSEQVFEEYLTNHGVEFERIPESDVPTPDYRLHVKPHPLIVEVKEFNRSPKLRSSGFCTVPLIREKIKAARRKFELYQDQECCLVLYNHSSAVFLQPELILRAMFGEHLEAVGPNAYRFSGLAEVRPHQNTRVSAVAALLPIHVGPNILDSPRQTLGITDRRELTDYEMLGIRHQMSDNLSYDKTEFRAVVLENPFARKPLSSDAFSGPLDERWARIDDGSFRLVVSGERIAELRAALSEHALRMLGI